MTNQLLKGVNKKPRKRNRLITQNSKAAIGINRSVICRELMLISLIEPPYNFDA